MAKKAPKKAKRVKPAPKTAAYLIRDIPAEEYEAFQARAKENGQEMKFLFLKFIRDFAAGAAS